MKRILYALTVLFILNDSKGQKIMNTDISNLWKAYHRIQKNKKVKSSDNLFLNKNNFCSIFMITPPFSL